MPKPRIVKDWNEMPPEVFAEGELYSTRVLCQQHQDSKAAAAQAQAELSECEATLESALAHLEKALCPSPSESDIKNAQEFLQTLKVKAGNN